MTASEPSETSGVNELRAAVAASETARLQTIGCFTVASMRLACEATTSGIDLEAVEMTTRIGSSGTRSA